MLASHVICLYWPSNIIPPLPPIEHKKDTPRVQLTMYWPKQAQHPPSDRFNRHDDCLGIQPSTGRHYYRVFAFVMPFLGMYPYKWLPIVVPLGTVSLQQCLVEWCYRLHLSSKLHTN